MNGASPEINDGMIPVIVENDGNTKKADLYSKWYSYNEKKWANMVLVTNESRESYKNATPGTIIESSDIIGYFVWIPRYKYKIPTSGTNIPSEINIIFEDKFTKKSLGNAKTEYLTAPGFTFGTEELNGVWIGKFETTGTESLPTVLPNFSQLIRQNNNNKFISSKIFNNYVEDSDAHMIKNSEWSAVTYLSHSKFGINNKVSANLYTKNKTGCGPNNTTSCEPQFGNNTDNYPQSTTGNITGIFDMSGGLWEAVMGNLNNIISNSGFSNMPDPKYYDLYTSTLYEEACNGNPCLGHALFETNKWYLNGYLSLSNDYPWIHRGGYHSHEQSAGLFTVNRFSGSDYQYYAFRVAIN